MTDAFPTLSTPATDADPSTNAATIADERRVRWARWVAAGRAATGLFALLDPKRALVPSERASTAARRVMRVLGARHLVQAGVEATIPTPTVLTIGAGVDAVHAVTCLGFAAFGGARWRRGVLVNAVTALGFCAVTATTARAHRPTPGSSGPLVHQGAHV